MAFRTTLAWIWEAMRCSEEKVELGAKKSRLTFRLCHQSPCPFLLPLRGHPAPKVPYNPDILWLFERKGREEWKRCELCWYSVWFTSDSPTDLVTFGTCNFSEGMLLYRKGNTSLIKCCEHKINDTSEELGSFTSVATSGIRLPLGMEMALLIYLSASTVWFGDRSSR